MQMLTKLCSLLEALTGNSFSCLFQILRVTHIPGLMASFHFQSQAYLMSLTQTLTLLLPPTLHLKTPTLHWTHWMI